MGDKFVKGNEDELVDRLPELYTKSRTIHVTFGGPSVYFHVQAIREQETNFLSQRHIEMIYATLASWGMHRMGADAKVKLQEFEVFKASILEHPDKLKSLLSTTIDSCSEEEYGKTIESLKEIYDGHWKR